MRLPSFLTFWKKWDDERRNAARKTAGVCLAAFTVYLLISLVSYLFNWRYDMSIVSGDMAGNAGGKAGNGLGRFHIGHLFGLGGFAFLIAFASVSIRLLFKNRRIGLLGSLAASFLGAFSLSVILSLVSKLLKIDSVLSGGLGGQCGNRMADFCIDMIGLLPTIMAALLVAAGAFFLTKKVVISATGTDQYAIEEAATFDKPKREKKKKKKVKKADMPAPVAECPEPDSATGPEDTPDEAPLPESGTGIITDITKDPVYGLPKYEMPPLSLLEDYKDKIYEVTEDELRKNKNQIRTTLGYYKIQIEDIKAVKGPTVTLYKVYPAHGVKISQIKALQDDIAMQLNAKGVRITTLSDSVGIEVANDVASIVPIKNMLSDEAFRHSKYELPVAIGFSTSLQKTKVFDLADAPHLLIAGATKQGKSVGLNTIVASLLYCKHPAELKFVFVDPKEVEFNAYAPLLKHYLAVLPQDSEQTEMEKCIVKKPDEANKVLASLCKEMDDRYSLMSQAGVNKVTLYNEKFKQHKVNPENGHRYLPYLVVIVDEFADLTMSAGATPEGKVTGRNIQTSIIRLAQKGRAAGMHVILATQRPSVDVISGIIKTNFPMRIAFKTSSHIDSKTIIDQVGAEKLIGRGDMLLSTGIDNERVQCAYIDGEETIKITSYIHDQNRFGQFYSTPYYLPEPPGKEGASGDGSIDATQFDEMFRAAAKLVVSTQKGSTSDIQRRLEMGYSRSGRVMDQLEAAGIVGPQDGSKPRKVLIGSLEELETYLTSLGL